MNMLGFSLDFVIDTFIILAITTPILFITYGAGYLDSDAIVMGVVDLVVSYTLPALFSIIFWLKMSTTPGKMLMKLKVLDENTGDPITPSQAVIRYVGYIVSSVVLLLGFIWVAFDDKKQGWYDKMAKTVVIKVH